MSHEIFAFASIGFVVLLILAVGAHWNLGVFVRRTFYLAIACLVLAALGFLAANAWYADDACGIEQWKCNVGTAGLAALIWGFVFAVALGAVALSLWVVHSIRAKSR